MLQRLQDRAQQPGPENNKHQAKIQGGFAKIQGGFWAPSGCVILGLPCVLMCVIS